MVWAIQIRNASKSICANIAEGFGKMSYSKAGWIRYLKIAVGSADETRVWIGYAFDLDYIEERTWKRWSEEIQGACQDVAGTNKKLALTPTPIPSL